MSQNTNQSRSENGNAKMSEETKASVDKAARQNEHMTEVARENISKMADLREQAIETTKDTFRAGVETVANRAQEATDRLTRVIGYSGDDSQRLAEKSKQDMEAVARCGTVLTQAFQTTSRNLFELGQKQFKRNLDGINRLSQTRSLQEFSAVQSELVRDSLQKMVQDSRTIAETSVRAVDEASKTFSSVAKSDRA